MVDIRIGHGYDVHKTGEGRRLVLGGVDVPYERGLIGHSDADVLTHAVMDAVLGALALGDIGRHFPDNDAAYKDANSVQLLYRCIELMKKEGYELGNLDATVIADRPKLAPYIPEMRANIARAFSVPVAFVNVKATTEEGLGFVGAGEGIRAHCVCILQR